MQEMQLQTFEFAVATTTDTQARSQGKGPVALGGSDASGTISPSGSPTPSDPGSAKPESGAEKHPFAQLFDLQSAAQKPVRSGTPSEARAEGETLGQDGVSVAPQTDKNTLQTSNRLPANTRLKSALETAFGAKDAVEADGVAVEGAAEKREPTGGEKTDSLGKTDGETTAKTDNEAADAENSATDEVPVVAVKTPVPELAASVNGAQIAPSLPGDASATDPADPSDATADINVKSPVSKNTSGRGQGIPSLHTDPAARILSSESVKSAVSMPRTSRETMVFSTQGGAISATTSPAKATSGETSQHGLALIAGADGSPVAKGAAATDLLGSAETDGTGLSAHEIEGKTTAEGKATQKMAGQAGLNANFMAETTRRDASAAEGLVAADDAVAKGDAKDKPVAERSKEESAGGLAAAGFASGAGAAATRETNAAFLYQMGRNRHGDAQGKTSETDVAKEDVSRVDGASAKTGASADLLATPQKLSADVSGSMADTSKVASNSVNKPEMNGSANVTSAVSPVVRDDATGPGDMGTPTEMTSIAGQTAPTAPQVQTQSQQMLANTLASGPSQVSGDTSFDKDDALDPLAGLDDLPPGFSTRAEHEAAKAAASPTSAANRVDLPTRVAMQIADAARQLPDRPVEITLSPEELGKVKLSFQVSENGAMHVVVQAERADTLDLMRRNIDSLVGEFRDLGYSDSGFSFESFDQGQSGQDSRNEGGSGFGGFGSGSLSGVGEVEAPKTPAPVRLSLDNSSGMDLRL